MTLAEFEILITPQVRQAIEQNIDKDPVNIALNSHLEHASLIATQVKRLQRAKSKLPSYYDVRAILPPRAYEQSSSERAAAQKRLSGDSVLELTTGLGVDALSLSRHFGRVVSCECDPTLSRITEYNLELLGADNVELLNTTAEHFLATTTDHFDWIYVDPDRRGRNDERLVLLEECSPNVVELMPQMRRIADNICIKCSPLFDTAEAERLFGECSVECVSVGGECKQVNIYIDNKAPTFRAEAVGVGFFEIERDKVGQYGFAAPTTDFEPYRYLILADSSLVHSRLTAAAFAGVADIWSNSGVALSKHHPGSVVGRVFEIAEYYHLGDKELKKRLKGGRVEAFLRDFPIGSSALYRKFSMREGSQGRWCFTSIGGSLLAFRLEQI